VDSALAVSGETHRAASLHRRKHGEGEIGFDTLAVDQSMSGKSRLRASGISAVHGAPEESIRPIYQLQSIDVTCADRDRLGSSNMYQAEVPIGAAKVRDARARAGVSAASS